MKSRRDFLKLMAAGSAAASLGRAGRVAAATATKSAGANAGAAKGAATKHSAPRTAALETELKNEKKSTADTLKKIRDYELSTSAPLAFVFKPMKPRKGGRS